MFNLLEIVRNDRQTYYNYATGRNTSYIWPKVFQLAGAILFSIAFSSVSDALIQSTLTIYSILIGFSFSVLFHLISNRKPNQNGQGQSQETKLRSERLAKLHDEIFYNVSYFILSSLILILAVLAFYIVGSVDLCLVEALKNWDKAQAISNTLDFTLAAMMSAFLVVFYYTMLDTAFCFIRIVGRITHYFQKKIEYNF